MRVEIKPMDSATFKLSTVGHTGPLRLNVEVTSRGDTADRVCYVDRTKNVSEDSFIWSFFKGTSRMILNPKRAYSQYFKTEQEIKNGFFDLNSW